MKGAATWGGMGAGALIGTAVCPGLGTLVGTAVGGLAGALGSAWALG